MADAIDIPIQAWLSYRCKDELARSKRDELERLCSEHNIRLVYDEADTEEGGHLIEFMEDLTSARSVFILLAPNYFESAYTLFELVCIHERGDLNNRFILPMRLNDYMVTYVWTQAKTYWDGNEAVRNECRRLLEQYWNIDDSSDDVLWTRIDAAWDSIVFPYLDTLRRALESGETELLLRNRVRDLRQTLEEAVREVQDTLNSRVLREIHHLLDGGYLPPLDFFQRELRLRRENTCNDVALKILALEASEAIAVLTRLMGRYRGALNTQQGDWYLAFDDAKHLCGWVLISTISPVWWFQHELGWKRDTQQGNSMMLSLESSAFIEVIISRSITQPALYELDERSQTVKMPYALENDVLIFDAVSDGAPENELLFELYKALFRNEPPSDLDDEGILERIYERAHSYFRRDRNKPVYFLVSAKKLSLLKTLPTFRKMEKRLAGYLQFICCEQPMKNYEHSPCQESQSLLLDQVALLLSLEAE